MTSATCDIRNIGILAGLDAGKATVAERLQLVAADGQPREQLPDSVETQAFSAQQKEKGVAIAAAGLSWLWRNRQINLVDTPPDARLEHEMERALRVIDGAVMVLAADIGVDPEAATLWAALHEHRVPAVVFVNRMDARTADFWGVVTQLNQSLDANAVAFEVPLWEQGLFVGIVDLIHMNAYQYEGFTRTQVPIPAMMMDFVVRKRQELAESLSEFDEGLCAKCLEQETIFPEEFLAAARTAVGQMRIVPVLAGTAARNNGLQLLLDAIVDYLPAPGESGPMMATSTTSPDQPVSLRSLPEEPASALCFKVIHEPGAGRLSFVRIFSGTLRPGQQLLDSTLNAKETLQSIYRVTATGRQPLEFAAAGDVVALGGLRVSSAGHTLCDPANPIRLEDMEIPPAVVRTSFIPLAPDTFESLLAALHQITREDPANHMPEPTSSADPIPVSSTSEARLVSLMRRLTDEFGLHYVAMPLEPALRETVTNSATNTHRIQRETAHGLEFALVELRVTPVPLGPVQFQFDAIPEESPLRSFVAAVRRGVEDVMEAGPHAGHRIAGVKVEFLSGECHSLESTDSAFRDAAAQAFRNAFLAADPVLYEPFVSVEFACPDEALPLLLRQIQQRRGVVVTQRRFRKGSYKVDSVLPGRALLGYTANPDLYADGKANYSVEFLEFRPMAQ